MRVSTREPDAAWRRREEDREIGTSSSWIGGIVAAIAIGTWLAGLVPSERFWAYADSFKFVVSSPMLASRWAPVVATATYLATLYSLKRFVATRGKPFDLMPVVISHNAVLSVASGILLVASLIELSRLIDASSLFEVYCDPDIRFNHGRIYFYYWVNYLFKYWELFDTVLLALRGKPTPFLHVYHHASTLALCWSQILSESCMQWLVMLINLFVHVVMYAYFAMHAAGIRVWWKRYLTMLQILQFVVVLLSCAVALAIRVAGEIIGIPGVPLCHGCYEGAFFGMFILASYLYLFTVLYKQSYQTVLAKHD